MQGSDMEHMDKERHWRDEWLPPHKTEFIEAGSGKKIKIGIRPWQKLAVTFLKSRQTAGYALIGDEMGVGKVRSLTIWILIL